MGKYRRCYTHGVLTVSTYRGTVTKPILSPNVHRGAREFPFQYAFHYTLLHA